MFTNSNSIDLARDILHETIHAELHRIKLSNNAGPNPLPTAQFNWYVKIWEYYDNPLNTEGPATTAEHYYMSNYFINPIAQGLKEFDNNLYLVSNYIYFAWEGLENYGKEAEYISQSELDELAILSNVVLNDGYTSPCDN